MGARAREFLGNFTQGIGKWMQERSVGRRKIWSKFVGKSAPTGLHKPGRTGLVREGVGANIGLMSGEMMSTHLTPSGTSPLLPGCISLGRTGLVREGVGANIGLMSGKMMSTHPTPSGTSPLLLAAYHSVGPDLSGKTAAQAPRWVRAIEAGSADAIGDKSPPTGLHITR